MESLEQKRKNAIKYLEQRRLLATQRGSQLIYTNSDGNRIDPPAWLKAEAAAGSAGARESGAAHGAARVRLRRVR